MFFFILRKFCILENFFSFVFVIFQIFSKSFLPSSPVSALPPGISKMAKSGSKRVHNQEKNLFFEILHILIVRIRSDAAYSAPRHHTIAMGPYRGVPGAPWIQQNPTWKNFTVFQPNLPHQTRVLAHAAVFGPKTRLRGSLRTSKRADAAYSAPGHHTISMGPHLGVPGAPWVRQNKKKLRISPVSGAPKKIKVPKPPKSTKAQKN